MRRPQMVDYFCKAGGASKGYHDAGFEVIGVDLAPQPNYPYEFVQGDAVKLLADRGFMSQFDAAAASPPCQGYSGMTVCRPGLAAKYPQLVDVTRHLLNAWGSPWVIENVAGAGLPVQDDLFGNLGVMLCGAMFGRRTYRHRFFEASFPVHAPHHPRHIVPASAAGHWKPGTYVSVAGNCAPIALSREVMAIDWMTRPELAEAIPPYFTTYLGDQMLEHMTLAGAA